ncbi:MAG: GerMN domain-containing protein [Treponema sp.]|nr:GerMN domain-containing protein [Treponema sp.]
MNYKELLSDKKNLIKLSIAAVSVIILLILIHIFSHLGTNRRVFIYPVSGSSKTKKEVRYLDSNPVQGKIAYYVDELILGPSFYRGRPLFTLGTKVEYCFLRDKTLYVGLSEEAALQESGARNIEESAALFRKNIKKNFIGIKNIELFIDGNFIDLELKD